MQKLILFFTFIIGILIGVLPFEYNALVPEQHSLKTAYFLVIL